MRSPFINYVMAPNNMSLKLKLLRCLPMKSFKQSCKIDTEPKTEDRLIDTLSISKGDKNHASKVKQSGRRSKALAKSCSSMLNVASACELHVPVRRSSSCGPRPVRDSMSTPRLAEVLSFREDNYPTARVDFVRYTRARACEENVLFLMEFEKFYALVERTRGQDRYHELVMAIAVKIVDDYVHDQALHPLNIDSKLKTQVLGYILECDLENIILSLSSIAKEIVAILEYGVWEQFVEWRRSQ